MEARNFLIDVSDTVSVLFSRDPFQNRGESGLWSAGLGGVVPWPRLSSSWFSFSDGASWAVPRA